jgi:rRNA processing protein Gar1
MRSSMLQRHEVLKYEEPLIKQPVYDSSMKQIGVIKDNDLVIVIGDETNPMIKVMLLNGTRGWTRYVEERLLSMEQAKPVEQE